MNEEIKCPQCGGRLAKSLGGNQYKCLYCGTTFYYTPTVESQNLYNSNESRTYANQTPPQQGQPVINVNVQQPQSSYSSSEDAFKKGAIGAAGFATGGCFIYILSIIAGPLIFLLILMSMCS